MSHMLYVVKRLKLTGRLPKPQRNDSVPIHDRATWIGDLTDAIRLHVFVDIIFSNSVFIVADKYEI